MGYAYSKVIKESFDNTVAMVTANLKSEGFGVLTQIDVQQTLKDKLQVDFRKYKILGACNPPFAYKALQAEENIGVMLPCNIIVQEKDAGTVSVSAIEPRISMEAVKNPALESIAAEIQGKLHRVIDSL
jgi:uncharacterized protein (DUF302 family)